AARGGGAPPPGAPGGPTRVTPPPARPPSGGPRGDRPHRATSHRAAPAPPFGFGDMLEAIASRVAPPGTELVWASQDYLLAQDLDDSALPLWPGGDPESEINAADPARANAAGSAPRPLSQTIDELQAPEAQAPTPLPAGLGLTPERETGLLAGWSAR